MLAPCPQPHPVTWDCTALRNKEKKVKPEKYKLYHCSNRDRKNLSGIGHSGQFQKCYSGDFNVGIWIMRSTSMHPGPREWGNAEESTHLAHQISKWSTLVQDLPQALAKSWLSLRYCFVDSFLERQLLHSAHTLPSPVTLGYQVQYLPWCSINGHSTKCFRWLVSATVWRIREDKHFTHALTVYQHKT